MNWIEQLFNISPDGGSGVTEGLILIALLVIVVGYPLGRYVMKKRGERQVR